MRRTTFSWAVPLLLSVLVSGVCAGVASAAPGVLIGDQSLESLADNVDPGQAEAFPFVAGASGTTASMNLYIDAQNTASTAVVGLYTDASNHPGSLLAQGETSSPAAGGWNSIDLGSAPVVAGDTYWVTVLGEGGALSFRDRSTGQCSSVTSAPGYLTSLPASWSSGPSWPTCSISAYITGEAATPPPPPPAPSNTSPPTISGTAQQGDTLTTSDGSWSNSPTSFAYQWQDCDVAGLNCSKIPGATSSSYTVSAGDLGDTLVSVVAATNAGGSDSQASAPTAVVLAAPSGPPGTGSIWPASSIPSTITEPDPNPVELGLKFQSAVTTTVTGVRFYKGPSNTGTHTGSLWSSTGSLLATVTFTNETASGWQQAVFPTPVAISANTTYVVSYHTAVGAYSADTGYFAAQGVTSGTLQALSTGAAGGNGVYAYGASAFPSQSYDASNYWVDVVTAGSSSGDTTPPSVPQNLTASASGGTQVDLKWTPSTDSSGVVGYDVYRNGVKLGSTAAANYSDPSVSAGTSYTYTVDAYDAAGNVSAQTPGVNVTTPTSGATTIFSDNFSGNSLGAAWTVISRHGEYAQSETECNVPQEVAVANNTLDIATVAQPTVCGDFNLDGSVRHAPSVWPYATGDVQWKSFNFTYGTVSYRAKFPPSDTGTWPAIWLLGSNCQATNVVTADVGYSSCPALETPGYTEIDMTECDTSNWCQLAFAQPTSFPTCGYPVDGNWHTFSLTWTPSGIAVSVDGTATGCGFTKANGYVIPSTPMFLIIQTQTGGVGGTTQDGNLPAHLDVSNVTVTQP